MAENGSITCAYRGKEGLKCAIGILIKDKFFNPKYNTDAISETKVRGMLCKSLKLKDLTSEDMDFLNDLQVIHDCDNVSEWKDRLHDFADGYSLNR